VDLIPSNYKYALAIVITSKKDIYGSLNQIKDVRNYQKINQFVKSNRYMIPMPNENCNAIGYANIFNTIHFFCNILNLILNKVIRKELHTKNW